ncbi:MAG: flippase-like domain-containing protein [Bacteroidota bacterium]
MSKKILQTIFFVLGLAVFGYLVYQLGWEQLVDSIQLVGWYWVPIILLALAWQACHTLAWHEVLTFFGHKVSFSNLFKLKMIAEAINMIVPSANLGGDTARASMIRKEVPLSGGIPSVMIDKTLDYISKMFFNIIGFSIAIFYIDIPTAWFWGCVVYLSFIFIFYALLVWLQIKGLSGWLLTITRLIPPLRKALEKRRDQLQLLDTNLKEAYTKGSTRLFVAGLWHSLGRMLGMVEIWLVLWLLGASTSFVEVFFVAAVVNVVNGVFFLVPGQWGVAEGAQLKLVELLGYGMTVGLSLGIIRRIRRLLLVGVGLLILLFYDRGKEMVASKTNPTIQ